MTTDKIQCEYCSSLVKKRGITHHHRSKKCQKAQEEKRQREEREIEEKQKEREEQSPVKESKEGKEEKIECKWCGTKVFEKHIERHYDTKKCMKMRILKEPSNLYRCKWCKQCFPSHEELSEHRDVCIKGKIYHLKQELYTEKENREYLIEQHKFELKEQEKEFKKEIREREQQYEEKLKEREQQYRNEMKEREQQYEEKLKEREQQYEEKLKKREQQYEEKLKEREQELKSELKSKDDFIKTLAKEPKYVTTNNHNTFNLNNYFKGNNGIDFDEKLIENKIEQCRGMMLETIDKHGFSDMKKIRDVKEKQIDILCKDDKTKKWNVVNTDSSRKTYTVCKRDNDKVLTVKDPNGKMMKMIVDKMDRLNNRCYYKVLAENTHLEGSRFYELEDDCNILVKESLWDKIPTKAMLSEQELGEDENISAED